MKKNGKCHDKCLKESLELQKCLRQLTHHVLAAQEDECKQISLELHDEIAQTLLAIHVRLNFLKQQNRSNTDGLTDEIASARQLVAESAKRVRKFARELALTTKVPTFGSTLHSEWHGHNSSLVRTPFK